MRNINASAVCVPRFVVAGSGEWLWPRISFFLVALLTAHALLPAELLSAICAAYVLSVIVTSGRIPYFLVRWAALPTAMIAIGLIGFGCNAAYDAAKDAWYFLNPVLALCTGCLIGYRRKGRSFGDGFVIAGGFVATYHIVNVLLNLKELSISQEALRDSAGAGYFAPLLAFLIVVYAGRNQEILGWLGQKRWLLKTIQMLAIVSIGLSFSRTIYVCTLMCLLANVAFKSREGRYVALIPLLFVVVMIVASQVGPFASSSRTLLSSFDELTPSKAAVTSSDVYERWRGLEAERAMATYESGSPLQLVVGHGFGKLIDLGFSVQIGEGIYHAIPIIHNGYCYVLVKTGIVGVILFGTFVIAIYRAGRQMGIHAISSAKVYGALLKSVSIILASSMAVVTGMYNKSALVPVMVLLGCLASRYRPYGQKSSIGNRSRGSPRSAQTH